MSVLVRDNVYKKLNETKKGTLSSTQTPSLAALAPMAVLFFPPRCLLTQNALHLVSLTVFKGAYYFRCHPPSLHLKDKSAPFFSLSCFFFLSYWTSEDHGSVVWCFEAWHVLGVTPCTWAGAGVTRQCTPPVTPLPKGRLGPANYKCMCIL